MIDAWLGVMAELARPLTTPRGLVISGASFVGLALVVAASFVRTMVPLRTLTLLSNLCLLFSAAMAPNPASVLLYCLLIPLNSYRLVEIHRLTRKVRLAAEREDLSGIWLRPYMKAHRLAPGDVLFRRGDAADSLYLVVEGRLLLQEIGKYQPPGQLFGEIAFFSPERVRTLTAVCESRCLVLSIGEDAFRRLYFQSPKFAFQVSTLIAQRLGADIARSNAQLSEARARCEQLERRGAAEPQA